MDQEIHIHRDDIVAFLKRGALLSIVAAVLAAGATFLFRSEVQPTYSATATLYAADNVLDMRSVGVSYLVSPALHVSAYQLAALSDEVLASALTLLGEGIAPEQGISAIRSRLDVRTVPESRLIMVSALAGTAQEAAATADAVASALVMWDAERPRANLISMIDGLRERIAEIDIQIQASDPGMQSDSLIALRSEQLAQLSTAVMLSDSVIGRLEVVQPAALPSTPQTPSPVFEAGVAGLLAFVLAYLVLLLATIVDSRVQDLNQLSYITALPILAAFPAMPKPPRRSPPVPTGFLRSELAPKGDVPSVILLTGVGRRSPTTRVAIGLAESFARAGYATLLVDTQANNRDLTSRFGSALESKSTLEAHLRSMPNGPNPVPIHLAGEAVLHVLPSHEVREETSELLALGFQSSRKRWLESNQIVIVSTPQMLEVADALTLAPHCDQVVLVVDHRSTQRGRLIAAVDSLGRRGASVAGLAVTNVPVGHRDPERYSAAPKGTELRASSTRS